MNLPRFPFSAEAFVFAVLGFLFGSRDIGRTIAYSLGLLVGGCICFAIACGARVLLRAVAKD